MNARNQFCIKKQNTNSKKIYNVIHIISSLSKIDKAADIQQIVKTSS
jgi:hypothetical protein